MDEVKNNITEETKHCPYCDEIIRVNAIKCKHCGSDLTVSPGQSGEITTENQIKSVLGNKFEIYEAIGRGGMASVYKAVQRNLNRLVALKVIHKNLLGNKDFLERFHREAQLAASLNHSNIVVIYDEGSSNGVNYIAMEYLDGMDLRSYIQSKGRLPVEETINIIAPIAEALDYAHNKGIIHRDIKSSNIFITSNGRAVLTDFGIAHAASETKLTQTGVVIGTPEYMSPEQAISGQVDAQSDLYSLGVVLYECITGDLPFKGETPISTIYKIVNDRVESITKTVPNAPRWLGSIVNKVLAKNKKNRFKSGKELSHALRARQEQSTNSAISEDETIVITNENENEIKGRLEIKKLKKYLIPASASFLALVIIAFLIFNNGKIPLLSKSDFNGDVSLNEFEKKRIELLMAEGDYLFKQGNIVTPEEGNAADKYYEVLKIQKGNDHAENQMKLIYTRLQDSVTDLLQKNNKSEAKKVLLLAEKYFPSEKTFTDKLKLLSVGDLERKAAGLISTDPLEAYNVCKEIQSIDQDNDYLKTALPEIKNKLISNADEEFSAKNYKDALEHYSKIKTLFGSDDELEKRIARSNSGLKKDDMLANADREFRKGNFKEALERYTMIKALFGKDRYLEQKIAKCNSEIESSNKIKIPNLIGLSLQEAQGALSQKGLVVGKISEVSSLEKFKGKIITQIPRSGTEAKKGNEVKLFIGK
ncbi:MAG TPA: protein kinase [Ignavibacteriales bacterium]|nr:protein kinase [Ignavibacteriales bacterium]